MRIRNRSLSFFPSSSPASRSSTRSINSSTSSNHFSSSSSSRLASPSSRSSNSSTPVQKTELHPDISKYAILDYVGHNDTVHLAEEEVGWASHRTPHNRLVTTFLQHIVRGEQDSAENLLKINPDLRFAKGNVTDYSNRTFKNISSIQYAAWAYDIFMLKMLWKNISIEQKPKVLEQLEELETKGTEHGSHYDFSSLIVALQQYVNNYDTWNFEQRLNYYRTFIGGAQRMVPAHIAQEYCHPHRSFSPTPTFNEAHLPRVFKFFNYIADSDSTWFPLSMSKPSLGTDFAIIRWAGIKAQAAAGCQSARFVNLPGSMEIDLNAMSVLCQVRQSELAELITQLRQSLQNPLLEETKPERRCLMM